MRKAISIVLAGLLILLPFEHVLAQAAQQQAVSVQQAPPRAPLLDDSLVRVAHRLPLNRWLASLPERRSV